MLLSERQGHQQTDCETTQNKCALEGLHTEQADQLCMQTPQLFGLASSLLLSTCTVGQQTFLRGLIVYLQ